MFRIRIRRNQLLVIALFVAVCMMALNLPLLHYAYMQLKGQLNIIVHSVDVQQIKPTLSGDKQQKVEIIHDALEFCEEELGLKTKGNYATYFEHGNSTLMYVVTASDPFSLTPYVWHFPIVGSFPYKGFFSKFYAQMEAQNLKEQGYDVRIGKASAWSTLGITSDPILSSMLQKDEGKLVELIIHEITHANIYYKDSAEYNENLADFIGHYGSLKFLALKYGDTAQEIEKHKLQKMDNGTYGRIMNEICLKLDSFYVQISMNHMEKETKQQKKEEFIKKLISQIKLSEFNSPERYEFLKKSRFSPNNAFFTSYLVYRSQQTVFLDQLMKSFNGNLNKLIQHHMDKSNS